MVNVITSQARGYRDDLRLRYERDAGYLLGLDFTRNPDEEEYAKDAPMLMLNEIN